MTLVLTTRRFRHTAIQCLALAIGAGVLAGACGGDRGSAPSSPPPATPAPPPTPPPPPPPPTCTVGLVLRAGDSCTYPGTSQTFTVNADGTATFGFLTSGRSINIISANLAFVATRQNDGSWIIERVGAQSLNRAPVTVGSISNQALTEDRAMSVDVSANFADPDGDSLTYRASSSQTSIVRVSVSGSQITLTPVAAGAATVTVTATDPGGLSANQTFAVTVAMANRAPRSVGAIPDQTLTEGGDARTIDVSARFEDPDGDALTYRGTSSRSSVVRVSVSGSQLTLSPVAVGTATVTVRATDPDGQSANQTFGVTVTSSNQAPRSVGNIRPQRLTGGGSPTTIEASNYFEDPDGDDLTYRASSSRTSVVRVSVSGSEVTLTPTGAGTAMVTMTATDPGGLSARHIFAVTVTMANRAPRAVGAIPDQTLIEGDDARTIDVSARFQDPDRDDLTYEASSSRPSVVRVSVSGSEVTLTSTGTGTARVTVTATDPGGLSANQTFAVTVTSPNRSPRAVGRIPDQTLTEGDDARTIDVSARFQDPDGDDLTYRASSSRTSVVRASASGAEVTLTPRSEGTATVTVTATDPGGESATQRFEVTVNEDSGATTNTFRTGERIPNFPTGAPDSSSRAGFVLFADGIIITIHQRGGYVQYGDVRYTCNAARCRIETGLVTVGEIVRTGGGETENQAPRAVGRIRDQMLSEGGSSRTLDVSENFEDPDGDTLSYEANSSRSSVVRVSVSGSDVTLTPRGEGIATVTVTATDPGGERATQRFSVTVEESETSEGCMLQELGTLRETPLTQSGTLGRDCVSPNRSGRFARFYTFRLSESGEVRIDLTSRFDSYLVLREGADISGRRLESDDDGGAGTNARITTDLSSGTYTIEATSLATGRTGDFTLTVARTEGGGGPSGPAADLELTSCSVDSAGSIASNVRFTMRGTVTANRRLVNVRVLGCGGTRSGDSCDDSSFPIDTDYIGTDHLGTIEQGRSKQFEISGSPRIPVLAFPGERYVCWVNLRGTVGAGVLAGTETIRKTEAIETRLPRK